MLSQMLFAFSILHYSWAAMCSEGGIELSSESTNNTNPLFVDPTAGQTFFKYNTNVGSATESKMNTIEYICAYVVDRDGDMWLVSEAGKGIARMTRPYVHHMAGSLGVSLTEYSYDYNGENFQELLDQVRADSQLQDEARLWVEKTKWTEAKALAEDIETRQLI